MPSCLLQLLRTDQEEEAIRLLMNNPSLMDSDTSDPDDSNTPLFYACCHGNLVLVELMLLLGAGVDKECSKSGSKPLHVAADYGHADIARTLLQYGANVNAATENGDTPAHFAAYRGHLATLAVLRAYGADVSIRNFRYCTPRDEAYAGGHKRVVVYLDMLGHDKKSQPHARTQAAQTAKLPLSEQFSSSRVDACLQLIEKTKNQTR